MLITGRDFHTRFQQIATADGATGQFPTPRAIRHCLMPFNLANRSSTPIFDRSLQST